MGTARGYGRREVHTCCEVVRSNEALAIIPDMGDSKGFRRRTFIGWPRYPGAAAAQHPVTASQQNCERDPLVVLDRDGVMTDNRVLVDEDGMEAVGANLSDC